MFKTTVQFKDFNDNNVTEDLYFHMLAPEFADLQFNPTTGGDLSKYIKEAMRSGDGQKIYTFFKLLVVNSYGRRSEDGSKFIKKAEFSEEFLNSRAWEQLFLWLTDDPKNAESFWNGIFPEAMRDKVRELEEKQGAAKKELRELTKEDLVKMLQEKTAGGSVQVIDSSASQ